MVQRIAIPPTEAAIAMRAVTVAVLVFEDADCTCGTAVSDGLAEDMDSVLVIVDATTLTVGVTGRGVKFKVEDVLEVDVEVDEEVFVAVEDAAEEEDIVEVRLEATMIEIMSVGAVEAEVETEVTLEECSNAVD
jgi:hypothetical protein